MSDFINGYEVLSEWKGCQQGQTCRVRKGSKKYILKRYNTFPMPINNDSITEDVYKERLRCFEMNKAYREKLNARLRSLKDKAIISPIEEFVHENKYTEVTEFVDGALDTMELRTFVRNLSPEHQMQIVRSAIEALDKIHSCKVAHSDLKPANILVVEETVGGKKSYSVKLIDFDGSFMTDEKNAEVEPCGTEAYMSPELMLFKSAEELEEKEEYYQFISEKTDMFSMAVILHELLSGDFPEYENLSPTLQRIKDAGRPLVMAFVLLQKGSFKLSPKIESPLYRGMLYDMLEMDSAKRPTAKQLLARIVKGASGDIIFDGFWGGVSYIFDKDKFISLGYTELTKTADSKYALREHEGKKREITIEELIDLGIAKKAKSDEPWPEHNVTFDMDRLARAGYVLVTRSELGTRKVYTLYRSDGSTSVKTLEQLTLPKYAIKNKEPVPTGFDEPWPEDCIRFDKERMQSRGYISLKQSVLGNGSKVYTLYHSNGINQVKNASQLIQLSYAIRCEAVIVDVSDVELCEPWEEDGIAFDPEKLKSEGYKKLDRYFDVNTGKKGYMLYRNDGTKFYRSLNDMIKRGYAVFN